MPTPAELLAAWRREERPQPTGWDFGDLAGRMTEDPVPWDFAEVCRQEASRAHALLDMGTGGGEALLALRAAVVEHRDGAWPGDVMATEGWAPNLPVARANLTPYRIGVVEFGQPDDVPEPAPMPFPDARFDLVINRHESYHPAEIARVLAPGGTFLTQQVGGDELGELHDLLGHPPAAPHVTHEALADALRAAGLHVVDRDTHVGSYRFTDVAALVAYLQRAPWEAPADFTVDRYADQLLELHRHTGGGVVRMSMKRFWLKAHHCTSQEQVTD